MAAQPAAMSARISGAIGPNAITRMAEALSRREGPGLCRQVFSSAGLVHHLDNPPELMVDEMDVAKLHRAVMQRLGPAYAADISWEAGRLTGDYLLAHRIPRLAQLLLSHLPRAWAARILVSAISRHAWTFSGSGKFSFEFATGLQLRIEGSPVCRLLKTQEPACHYFAATFERVFSAMLGPRLHVMETECEASGSAACTFRVMW